MCEQNNYQIKNEGLTQQIHTPQPKKVFRFKRKANQAINAPPAKKEEQKEKVRLNTMFETPKAWSEMRDAFKADDSLSDFVPRMCSKMLFLEI